MPNKSNPPQPASDSPPAARVRVAIVEDDEFIRQRVTEEIRNVLEFSLVAACASAEEALEVLPGARPDVVLMDIGLPNMKGTECVRRLKPLLPRVQVLMLTVYEDSRQIFEALLAGASGYLLKRTKQADLLEAIHQVREGGSPMSGHIARKVVQHFNQIGARAQQVEQLSPREKEVLDLLAQGLAYKEIADKLALSIETIRMNVKHIYSKLHVHSRGEAVAKYVGR